LAQTRRARGLAEDRHPARVAAEGADVVLHPAQGGLRVGQGQGPRAGRALLGAEGGVGDEAERTQPVVDGDHDDVAEQRELACVVGAARAEDERPAVDPDHDGQAAAPGEGVVTLRERQSSPPTGAGAAPRLSWVQTGPGRVASRTPRQSSTGCGGWKRRSPTGGAAYGMPWKRR
jgi:hypothetical protein